MQSSTCEMLIWVPPSIAFDSQILSARTGKAVLRSRVLLFFASLTFIRWYLSRRSSGTNLGLGDKLQEPFRCLCKQTVCALCWDFVFNLEQQKFKKRPLSHSIPLLNRLRCDAFICWPHTVRLLWYITSYWAGCENLWLNCSTTLERSLSSFFF